MRLILMDRTELEQWTGREVARLLALLETERRYYQEILSALPIAAAVVTRNGSFTSANRAFRQLFGMRSEQFSRYTIAQLLPSTIIESAVRESLNGCAHSRFPVQISDRNFAASVTPVRGWDDEVETLALLTLEEQSAGDLPVPLNAPELPAVIWTLNPETLQFTAVEGWGEHLLGYSAGHWLSSPGFHLNRIHVDDRARVEELYRVAILRSGEFGCEFRAVKADGKVVWCRDTVQVACDETGRVSLITGITTNVTTRQQTDADVIQANRVDALVGLSRRLSHDLNNALMIVTGYGEELLAALPENDSRRGDVMSILSAAESMAGVTGELHGFTRRQAAPAKPMDVAEVLKTVADRVREELDATLVLRVPPVNLRCMADPIQLEAALISIARRLRDKSNPHMIVAASAIAVHELSGFELALKPGQYIEISLRGPCLRKIPPAAFEAFISGKDPHASDLARTYAIVREWGGSMFTGRVDHQAEIRVLLPAVVSEPEQKEPVATVAGKSTATTVLVVEDEKGIRALVRKLLTREGYKVLEASSAEEALDVVREHHAPIQLLLADILLPGKSGRELADDLQLSYPSLKVVYISGYTGDVEVTSSDTLQKPFTLTALMRKVHEALS